MNTTLYTARAVIVIAAKDQAAANAACESVAKGGSGTFTVPVYDATDTLAGYLCNWQMLPEEATALKAAFTKAGVVPLKWADCDNWDPAVSTVSGDTVTTSLGLKTTTATVAPAPQLTQTAPLPLVEPVPPKAAWWRRAWRWLRARLLGWLHKDWR